MVVVAEPTISHSKKYNVKHLTKPMKKIIIVLTLFVAQALKPKARIIDIVIRVGIPMELTCLVAMYGEMQFVLIPMETLTTRVILVDFGLQWTPL